MTSQEFSEYLTLLDTLHRPKCHVLALNSAAAGPISILIADLEYSVKFLKADTKFVCLPSQLWQNVYVLVHFSLKISKELF